MRAAPADALWSRFADDDPGPTTAAGPTLATVPAGAGSRHKGPGLGISLTQRGITEGRSFLTPYFFQALRNLSVPDIEISGVKLTHPLLTIYPPDPASVNLTLVKDANGLNLVADDIDAKLVSEFSYSYFIFHTKGDAHIRMNGLRLHALLNLSTQNSTLHGTAEELAPKVLADAFEFDVDPDNVAIDLHGDIIATLADVLLPLLKGVVVPGALGTWRESMASFINTQLNAQLASHVQTHIPSFANITFDFAQVGQSPRVSQDELTVTVNGTFFDAEHVKVSELSPAAFIVRDPKEKQSKEVQIFLTDYVLNTALASARTSQESLDLAYLLKKGMNYTLSTDSVDSFLPGLLAKYGPGKAVNLSGRLTQDGGTAFFTPGDQKITVSLLITAAVEGEVAVEAEFVGISLAASLRSDVARVFGNISRFSLGTLLRGTFHTTLDLSAEKLFSHLQGTLDRFVSRANMMFAPGLVVPSFFGVNASNFEVHFFDGYAQVGFSFSESVRDAVRGLQPSDETEA